MPGHTDPLASLGLSAARIKELTKLLRQLHSAEEDPDDALDALLAVSSLAQPDDASRTVLMGGSILDALADLICICDEEWISGEEAETAEQITLANAAAPLVSARTATAAADPDDDPDAGDSALGGCAESEEDHRLSLELCSRALNALGSLASFVPFVSSVLEEDRTDEAMEPEAFEPIARVINTAAAVASVTAAAAASPVTATGASSASSSAAPFRARQFLPGSLLSFYPLLTACLFWLCCPRFRGVCQPQAAYALSWLLVLRPVALMLHEAGLAAVLFGILREQQQASAAGRSSRAGTPDSTTSSGTSASERVSSTQENLRLFTLICLQRLSRTDGLKLFSDPLETPVVLDARLETLLSLLLSVPSFNIRAIVLNVLLQAVTPPTMALTTPLPRRPAAAASAAASKPTPDLVLPPAAMATLRDFRANCGSIGSSSASSSRRTSPALGSIVSPMQRVPSATLGGAAHSGAAANAGSGRSWRAMAAPAAPASSSAVAAASTPASAIVGTTASSSTIAATAAAASPAASASAPAAAAAASSPSTSGSSSASSSTAASAPSCEDDEVCELSRDPEAALDKTAHLQQLVDAIMEQARLMDAMSMPRV